MHSDQIRPAGMMYNLDHTPIDITTAAGRAALNLVFQDPDRMVASTWVRRWGRLRPWQRVRVSTVFLVVDHGGIDNPGPPILYETMIFNASGTEPYADRYCTREYAIRGHGRAVRWARWSPSSDRAGQPPRLSYMAAYLAKFPSWRKWTHRGERG